MTHHIRPDIVYGWKLDAAGQTTTRPPGGNT